jgi:RNA:NAD 2'-phosphotransferase (TPT1/KptA family)
MLRECKAHGSFLGQNCPVCNDEGKFIMSDREMSGLGRLIAGVLRHFPEKFGLEMDLNGWVDLNSMAVTTIGSDLGTSKRLPSAMTKAAFRLKVI